MSRLSRLRESRGLRPEDVARKLGMSLPSYFDLEAYLDDLTCAISIRDLRALCAILETSPSALLSSESEIVAIPTSFVDRLVAHLERIGQDARTFSSAVGWDVEGMLANADEVGDLNVDGFKAICAAIGLNWLTVLDEMRLSASG